VFILNCHANQLSRDNFYSFGQSGCKISSVIVDQHLYTQLDDLTHVLSDKNETRGLFRVMKILKKKVSKQHAIVQSVLRCIKFYCKCSVGRKMLTYSFKKL